MERVTYLNVRYALCITDHIVSVAQVLVMSQQQARLRQPKRPTQHDVARLAGVSRATVSYVINGLADSAETITEETRQRVLKAVDELGYQPDAMAQSLRSGISRTVGLLIPDLHNPHYWQIISGVDQEVRSAGYDLLMINTALDPSRELHSIRALSQRRIDGLILLLTFPGQVSDTIRQLAQHDRPLILINGSMPGMNVVSTSYSTGATELMSYLLASGHCRIGLIYGVAHPDLGIDRLNAYRHCLQNAGIDSGDQLVEPCGTTLEDGYAAAHRLLDRVPAPTAIIAINDLLAIGALRAALERGLRVPNDLSVASFDDIDVAAYLNPPLTTVRIDAEQIGRSAAQQMFARLQTPDLPPQTLHLSGRLIIRASTGKAPPE